MLKHSKLLLMAISMLVFAGAANMAFAQDPQDEKTALYEKYLACRKDTDPDKKRACIEHAKQYLAKYGADNDEYVTYLQKQVENFKKWDEDQANQKLFERYNSAVKSMAAINADEAFSAGKEILGKGLLSQSPSDELDVLITLATLGLDKYQAVPPVDKFNADALNYARLALQKINSGTASKNFGNYGYACTTKANPDGKSNCLGYMNFTIGYFMYYWQGQKKDALPFFYKAAQFNSAAKKEPTLYGSIADWYFSELVKLNQLSVEKVKLRDEKLKTTNGVVNDEIKSLNDEIIQLIAMQRGYADRALHAYALDYGVESTAPANQTFRDNLKAKMQQLYEFRFEGKKDGLDDYIASSPGRALADPSSAVAPIAETPPAAPTGTATATTKTATAPATATTPKTQTPATSPSVTTTTASPTASATTKSTKTSKKVVAPAKKPVKKPRR